MCQELYKTLMNYKEKIVTLHGENCQTPSVLHTS